MSGDAMARRDDGFTLIEVLVATAVFALLISALYQGLTTGWRGLRHSDSEEVALALLSAKLASAGVETPLQAAILSGTEAGGLSWQTSIAPYADAASPPDARALLYQGYWVTVIVRWQNDRFSPEQTLQATTLKIRRAS
jgi:prepilin-type N-terminal cleavage/methylation domain-containing protein